MIANMKALHGADQIRVVEVPHCPLCEAKGRVLYRGLRDTLYHAPGVWSLSQCLACQCLWLNPRPHEDDIHKCYAEYFTHDIPVKSPPRSAVRRRILDVLLFGRNREIKFYDSMFLHKERPGRLLDIGCGDGAFLERMRKQGWDVIGFEFDPEAARVARENYGLQVVVGSLDECDFPSNAFDAITLSHVIEHLPNPKAVLQSCCRLLKENGKLAITTPNIKSLGHRSFRDAWRGLEPPRHLILYSRDTLKSVLEETGLRVVMSATSDRAAGFIFEASGRIEAAMKNERALSNGYQSLRGVSTRTLYMFIQHWGGELVKDIGEEIGILAVKVSQGEEYTGLT